MEWCIALVMALLLNCPAIRAEDYNDTKTLMTTLFDTNGYNNKIRPIENQDDVLNISIAFYLSSIADFDEQEESLTTSGFLSLFWEDRSLTWDPNHYNGLTRLFIPQDDIWKPDVSLRNSYTTFKGLGSSYFNAWVGNDGKVYWEPFQVLKSTCSVDITYFPYDTQTCTLKFIAWSYTKSEINFQSYQGIEKIDYAESSTWELVRSTSESNNAYEASITYTLTLQRKPLFYVFNMILPVVLLSVLNVFTFVLPISSGERAGYSVTVFLSLTVFLTIVASEFPKNSDTSSLLAVYLILMVCISTTYVLLSVIQLRLASRNDEKQPIGKYYKKFYNMIQVLQCKRCNPKKGQVADSESSKTIQEQTHDITWSDVTDAMDVAFFWIGLLLTFLVTLILMLMLSFNPDKVTSMYQ